ncbi:MAG: 5-formyltetrahydrofolate cyclo-ligase [Omnitrophica bacterium RIFCSPHIGHO2_02_FULL_51_18]|nr:MAG: 5-formyltetrahydrofolate cyclo-ligase [Omnitrophica bacterium RIFCSPHIGHO2_02_FULL_51_18]
MSAKNILRKKLVSNLASKSPKELRTKSRFIAKKLLKETLFLKARHILFYVSLPREVDTRRLIDDSLRLGKKVSVPRVDVRHKKLTFYRIKSRKTDLKKGGYGIMEPIPARTRLVRPQSADLAVIPGIAFDKANHRLGRGAGFYDRFLRKVGKKVPKIGLAFSFQIVARVPRNKHDQKVDKVITD